MGGVVVRAERGERQRYRPIVSSLAESSDPLTITQALLRLYPFTTLYIADLDAIMGSGSNLQTVQLLQRHFPSIKIWLDAGINQTQQLQTIKDVGLTCVIGSERITSLHQYQQLRALESNFILSLDFGNSGFLGDTAILEHDELWPQRLICMTLDKVGSYGGLDWERLLAIQAKADAREVYAAGGTRNIHDLSQLSQSGIRGALIASALHDGTINADHLRQLSTQ